MGHQRTTTQPNTSQIFALLSTRWLTTGHQSQLPLPSASPCTCSRAKDWKIYGHPHSHTIQDTLSTTLTPSSENWRQLSSMQTTLDIRQCITNIWTRHQPKYPPYTSSEVKLSMNWLGCRKVPRLVSILCEQYVRSCDALCIDVL